MDSIFSVIITVSENKKLCLLFTLNVCVCCVISIIIIIIKTTIDNNTIFIIRIVIIFIINHTPSTITKQISDVKFKI